MSTAEPDGPPLESQDPAARPDPAPELGVLLAQTLLARRKPADPTTRELLLATIVQLCRDRAAGHVCLPLAELAGQSRRTGLDLDLDAGLGTVAMPSAAGGPTSWPSLPAWTTSLLASGLCARSDAAAALPLVLDAGHRLYLHRDFAAERTIRADLADRLAPRPVTAATVTAALRTLGLLPTEAGLDWQLAAIVAAARSGFLVLTGGPGTGKTTTVARLLGVLQQLNPGLRIAITAPTGKAAARLGQALQQSTASHAGLAALAASLVPTTLHRLLGYRPREDTFLAGPSRQLPYDVVVVDEASMVDPAVLAVLCQAMPPTATLLLVGDRDQLAAVAAGQVLGDLCRASAPERGVGPALAAFVQQTTGMALPVASAAPRLADHVIALRHSHRFGQRPGLGSFAQALAARQPAAAQAALFAGHPDLQHSGSPEAALAELADLLLTAARATTPAAALAALGSLRILTAVRHGPHGAEAWNHRVEALLRSRGCRIDGPWYAGRPVLVTANDHQSRLWNGDLGVTWRGDDGRYVVLFATTAGGHRAVPPLRLPAHTTAWAMTVHKAQGSEFDHVLLAMPDADGPWWQASLLYTAVTRARQRAIVVADPARLPAALAHWPTRLSGLATGWE